MFYPCYDVTNSIEDILILTEVANFRRIKRVWPSNDRFHPCRRVNIFFISSIHPGIKNHFS